MWIRKGETFLGGTKEANNGQLCLVSNHIQQQIGWITSLRALATISVVVIHVIGGWKGNGTGPLLNTRDVFDLFVIQMATRWAVPVFAMISGCLLLDPDKTFPISKIWRYFKKMILCLLFFGLPYCIIENLIGVNDGSLVNRVVDSLVEFFSGRSWSHMWYVYAMAGIYLILPLLRAFVKNATKKEFEMALLTFFISSIVVPTINTVFNQKFTSLIPMDATLVFYMLVGYYLSKYKFFERKNSLIVCILAMALMAVFKILNIQNYEPNNFLVAIYSVSIFNVLPHSAMLEKISGLVVVQEIARYSFGIYVLHPVFLNLLNKGLHIYPDALPIILGELIFALIALAGAYIAAKIACIIPVMRRALM